MNLSDAISKRLFIVGCSRSGTTVLQVSLASHPRIHSFPETFFFLRLPGILGRPGIWLGLPSKHARPALEEALERLGQEEGRSRIPSSWRLHPYVQAYIDTLDQLALEVEADTWVEKTPQHIFRLRSIRRYIPDAHVIHMIRDGRDVVASTCHRAQEYPNQFAEKQQDPAFSINRWNRALHTSLGYLNEPGHSFVIYEEFVQNPEQSLRRLCREVGLSFTAQMVERSDEAAESVIPDGMQWLDRAKEPPERRDSKYDRLFSVDEKNRIESQLDLHVYDQILESVAQQ